jgi:acetyl esterase/lipase
MEREFMEPIILPVWTQAIPGEIQDPDYKEAVSQPWGGNCWGSVSQPQLYVYKPSTRRSKAAVIICPGGGYEYISYENEGFMPAEWLAALGLTAIVLKYRLPSGRIMATPSLGPLQDVQESVRYVRRHAAEWGIAADQILIMGSSAGGHLAASSALLYDHECYAHDGLSARPDGAILAYPVVSMREGLTHAGSRDCLLGEAPQPSAVNQFSLELHARPDAPPCFLFHSTDDGAVPWRNSALLAEALADLGVDVNLHLFSSGGHGYGLARGASGAHSSWPLIAEAWLESHGWLSR